VLILAFVACPSNEKKMCPVILDLQNRRPMSSAGEITQTAAAMAWFLTSDRDVCSDTVQEQTLVV